MTNRERYFYTTSFHLASFLFAKGCDLLNIDRTTNEKRATFVFDNTTEVEELVYEFNFAKENDESVLVDARKLIYATKSLKEKLYQDRF